ncbi:MAG: hypothetical protein JNM90_23250, partial [Burkholderiales bacterium]|nr:hypothetical protein [Burkholderiales bacterium]
AMQSHESARAARKALRKDTFEGHVTDFIATHERRAAGVQAFLVEQDPHWVTPPHFHLEAQFQVVVAGGGAFGRHPVAPLAVHYAAPQTGYGPISAGPQGVSYLTLRADGDTGAWYLHKPGSRERMEPGRRREQLHGAPAVAAAATDLAALRDATAEALIAPRADGLAAFLLRLPPARALDLPAHADHGGRYYVVTRGTVQAGADQMPALAVAFASADDRTALRAGAAGAEVLVLQFPGNSSTMEETQ